MGEWKRDPINKKQVLSEMKNSFLFDIGLSFHSPMGSLPPVPTYLDFTFVLQSYNQECWGKAAVAPTCPQVSAAARYY